MPLLVFALSALLVGQTPATPPSEIADGPTPGSLRAWHDAMGSEPHVAGSDGDRAVIETIATGFRELGLETEVWTFEPFLARPVRTMRR